LVALGKNVCKKKPVCCNCCLAHMCRSDGKKA
jgi:endonuclease III